MATTEGREQVELKVKYCVDTYIVSAIVFGGFGDL